ncbi:MAG TPA: hypothetical protein VF013_00820 [Candidatus Limnocylindria bacterium]
MADTSPTEAVESLAKELRRRGLGAPVRLLLDAHRPLRPLLGDALTFIGPTLRPILGRGVADLERAVRDPAAYERLIDDLGEDPAETRR